MEEQDSNIVFHYSRKERLEHAPENVKKLHSGEGTLQKGLLKVLTASKSLRFLFFSIALLVVFGIGFSLIDRFFGDTLTIQNWDFEITPFEFENSVYFSLQISSKIEKSPVLASFIVELLDNEKTSVAQLEFEEFLYPEGIEIKNKLDFSATEIKLVQVSVSSETFFGMFQVPLKKSK